MFFGVAGLTVFLARWNNERDTELAGGFRAEMELKRPEAISDFRARVGKLFPMGADVQSVWSSAEAGLQAEKGKLFSIRIRQLTDEQRQVKMREDFVDLLKAQQLYGTVEKNPDPKSWDFTLHLARPISPLALRDLLARRRYTESDIRRITLMDKEKDRLPSEFAVKLKASALEANPETQIAAVLDAFESLIGQETVVVTIDPVTTEEAAHVEGAAAGPEVRADPPRGHPLDRGGAPGALPRHPENQARRDPFRRTCASPGSARTPVPKSAATWPSTERTATSTRSPGRRRLTCG